MIATQMRNFAYLIGDRRDRDAWSSIRLCGQDLVDTLEADGMHLSGVLVTHHHPDHVGGTMMGFTLKGLAELMERRSVPIHVNTHEAQWVSRITDIPMSDLTSHDHGDKVSVGDIEIELLHTPGHAPGSQCFLLDGRLVAGDTLFLEAGNPESRRRGKDCICLTSCPTATCASVFPTSTTTPKSPSSSRAGRS